MVANPYPGLRPFTETDSSLFFGRQQQVDELIDRLQRRRFIAVIGTSGSGKSSLVRAGLLPALHLGEMGEEFSGWRVAVFRPGIDPVGALAAALDDRKVLGPDSDGRQILESSARGLAERTLRASLPDGTHLLLVVDQFEEVFRYRAQGPEGYERAAKFVRLLLHAVSEPWSRVYVLLTMRSDYLGKCSRFYGLPEALNDSQYLVPRLTREQLQQTIEEPARIAGQCVTPRLVQRFLNESGESADQLPVLQHALMRVWEASAGARESGEPIDLAHYEGESVGGISGALNRDADSALSEIDDSNKQKIARRIFQRLVDAGGEDEETRRPTRKSELAAVCQASDAEIDAIIEPFWRREFLVISSEADPLVDISHESLIRLWDKLKTWVNEESESAQVYLRLADWVKEDFPLYSGLALDQALHWRDEAQPNEDWARRYRSGGPTFEQVMAFLQRSHQAREEVNRLEEKRRHRQLRRTRAALALGAVFVLISAILGLRKLVGLENAVKKAEPKLARYEELRGIDDLRLLAQRSPLDAIRAIDELLNSPKKNANATSVSLLRGLRWEIIQSVHLTSPDASAALKEYLCQNTFVVVGSSGSQDAMLAERQRFQTTFPNGVVVAPPRPVDMGERVRSGSFLYVPEVARRCDTAQKAFIEFKEQYVSSVPLIRPLTGCQSSCPEPDQEIQFPDSIEELSSGEVGREYRDRSIAKSLSGARVSLALGALPPGLAYQKDGGIVGTPTEARAKPFVFVLRIRVGSDPLIFKKYSIQIVKRTTAKKKTPPKK